ncbi:MAG: PEPxxWA-CTERM sorting domain-containing protein [Pseudomonadota bacterium]|uniref:PEPxxWA-CTERM sorting domain-containing protein n=1 Tax=Phenylobacterium sp. TaxID=1871053 RepID=UPI0025F7BD6D|nr:PEPxxWA-CTERM sorting domain-containing protein [Phenylobacterium sp.]
MTKFQGLAFAAATVALALAATPAGAATTTVINFDDLTGVGLVQEGYVGLKWSGDFSHYDLPTPQFPTASGQTAIYANYAKYQPGAVSAPGFEFGEAVQFNGAYFSGNPVGLNFRLYLDGQLVHETGSFAASDIATYLASGYSGLVNRVEVFGYSGSWVMDDLTFTTGLSSAVPEPATWAMMIVGFGAAGSMVRSARRRRGAIYAA